MESTNFFQDVTCHGCQMCSKPFSDPRMLPCLHSFCFQCIRNEMEKVGPQQSIQCPTCLKVIPCILVGGADNFPPNLHLQFEVDVAGYISKFSSGSAVLCTFCANSCSNHADMFCTSCHMLLCKIAQECHRHDPKLSLHEVIALGKETAILLPTILKPTDQYCSQPQHKTKELHLYCNTCSSVICNKCALLQHRAHNITLLQTVIVLK